MYTISPIQPRIRDLFILANKRVLARAKLDTQWSAYQRESFTEMLFQITLVIILYALQRVAVNHNHRWIHPALVRIAQLRTNRTLAAWLLMLHGLNQRSRQFRRSQIGHRCRIGRIDGFHQWTDAAR